jgi:hypothetical protein
MHHRSPSKSTKQNMSTRLSETIASLHENQVVDLQKDKIDSEGAVALAEALK